MGSLLSEKTVGIVGMGTIGRKLTSLLRPFNCNVLASDHFPDMKYAKENNIDYVSLDELLRVSDVVTAHLPLDNDTKGLFNTNLFMQMKEGAIFINTSRGKIVDEEALFDVLNEPYTGKLKELDNVTLTCHAGSYAREARVKMESQAVENLIKGFSG